MSPTLPRSHTPILVALLPSLLLAQEPAPDSGIPHLAAGEARGSVLAAIEVFNGIRSKDGTISLVNLKLQTNTLAGILHNLIGREIGRRSDYWRFIPSGAAGGDLEGKKGEPLELKTSSDLQVKGNQVSHNNRYYLVSHFVVYPKQNRIAVVWIRGGRLDAKDWRRPKGTQWAFVTREGEAKLKTIWKNFKELPASHLRGIGKKRQQLLEAAGIFTVNQFAKTNLEQLREILNISARQVEKMMEEAKGISDQ